MNDNKVNTNSITMNSPAEYYKRLKKEYVKCDLCGADRKKHLHTGDRYNMDLKTVYCKKCGLIFTDPRPVKDEMDKFYSENYRFFYESVQNISLDYVKKRPHYFERASIIYDVLEKNINLEQCNSIFDLGCGEGSFLKLISTRQPHIQRFATEPSIEFSRFAAEYSSSNIFTGNLDEYMKAHLNHKEQFDIIVLSHVLEHFLSPSRELQQVWKLLKPGGYMYIEVPNITSPFTGPFMFHLAHTYHFCPETLDLLLLKQGFHPIYSKAEGTVENWSMFVLSEKTKPVKIRLPNRKRIKNKVEFLQSKIPLEAQKKNLIEMSNSGSLLIKIVRFIKYQLVWPFVRKASILVLNYDMVEVGKQLDDLEKANKNLLNIHANLQKSHAELQNKFNVFYKTFNLIMDDPKVEWLYKNRIERMDASVEVFDEIRRKFHHSRYEFACQYVAGKAAADIACGTGYGTDLLVNLGKASRATGVDIDPDTIEYAKDKHMHEGIEFICASGDNTGIPSESVDVVISFETIEHVPDDIVLLDEFHRILRPDGVLVCSTPNNWPADISVHHYRTYDRKKFETMLSKLFQNIEFYNQNSGTSWEHNHEQPAGILKTTAENEALAECYIAVCRKKTL